MIAIKNKIVKKNFAFTLAEVLITLGIIGVIAALTIPALINKIQNAELVTAFLKNYSILQQASRMIINDSDGSIKNVYTSSQTLADAFASKLSVAKSCANGAANGICWPQLTTIKTLAGNMDFTTTYNDDAPTLMLKDGSIIRVYTWFFDSTCATTPINFGGTSEGVCAVLHIDVNGFKKPNQLGRDIFEMSLFPIHGLLPNGTQGSDDDYKSWSSCSTAYTNGDSGCGCAARVLNEHAMNY